MTTLSVPRAVIAPTITRWRAPGTSRRGLSVYGRIAQQFSLAREKSAYDLIHGERSIYRRVEDANRLFREFGQEDLVIELMAGIDGSLASRVVPPLEQALHEAEMADASEQPADEGFREKLRRGTATVEDADEYLRKSAIARHRAEVAEEAVRRWKREQEQRQ